ncbi:unnamed protein product [Urochloa humidicola]
MKWRLDPLLGGKVPPPLLCMPQHRSKKEIDLRHDLEAEGGDGIALGELCISKRSWRLTLKNLKLNIDAQIVRF